MKRFAVLFVVLLCAYAVSAQTQGELKKNQKNVQSVKPLEDKNVLPYFKVVIKDPAPIDHEAPKWPPFLHIVPPDQQGWIDGYLYRTHKRFKKDPAPTQ